MPLLDLVDSTFIAAPVAELHEIFCDEAQWFDLGITMSCFDDRGMRGRRWTVEGSLNGTAEIWLEEAFGGVVVHCFLQADPVGRGSRGALSRRFERPLKRWLLEVKRGYDIDRPAGVPGVAGTSMGEHIEPDEEG